MWNKLWGGSQEWMWTQTFLIETIIQVNLVLNPIVEEVIQIQLKFQCWNFCNQITITAISLPSPRSWVSHFFSCYIDILMGGAPFFHKEFWYSFDLPPSSTCKLSTGAATAIKEQDHFHYVRHSSTVHSTIFVVYKWSHMYRWIVDMCENPTQSCKPKFSV